MVTRKNTNCATEFVVVVNYVLRAPCAHTSYPCVYGIFLCSEAYYRRVKEKNMKRIIWSIYLFYMLNGWVKEHLKNIKHSICELKEKTTVMVMIVMIIMIREEPEHKIQNINIKHARCDATSKTNKRSIYMLHAFIRTIFSSFSFNFLSIEEWIFFHHWYK